jgi:hypothetical protein
MKKNHQNFLHIPFLRLDSIDQFAVTNHLESLFFYRTPRRFERMRNSDNKRQYNSSIVRRPVETTIGKWIADLGEASKGCAVIHTPFVSLQKYL